MLLTNFSKVIKKLLVTINVEYLSKEIEKMTSKLMS